MKNKFNFACRKFNASIFTHCCWAIFNIFFSFFDAYFVVKLFFFIPFFSLRAICSLIMRTAHTGYGQSAVVCDFNWKLNAIAELVTRNWLLYSFIFVQLWGYILCTQIAYEKLFSLQFLTIFMFSTISSCRRQVCARFTGFVCEYFCMWSTYGIKHTLHFI